jgi:hypothetical protein
MEKAGTGDYAMEMGPMGPIGEGESLILRVNRNCPWNRCFFCPVYKGRTFSARSVADIKADIEAVRRACESLERNSFAMDLSGRVSREVVQRAIRSNPSVYGTYPAGVTESQWKAIRTLSNVANWMIHGSRRVFLQDADAVLMKTPDLLDVLRYLRESFPSVRMVSSYARSLTCHRRTPGELRELHDAGLSWCYVGIESGCDDVLSFMKKGVSKKQHISGGRKLMDAGILMAAFVMPGLAGAGRERAEKHIRETVEVLNEIRPTEVRVRSLAVQEDSPLYGKWKEGEFRPLSDAQMAGELRRLIEGLSFDCSFETLQMTNMFTMRGRLPLNREVYLEEIGRFEALSPPEKARFILSRYEHEGYMECVESWGLYDRVLDNLVREAESGIRDGAEDSLERVDRAVFALKSKGIP